MMDRKSKFEKAFSFTEIMLVLAVMAILSGLFHVSIQSRRQEVEAKNIVECIKIYESAVQMYYLYNNNVFPDISNGGKLEEVEALERYRPENFNTHNLIKLGNCSGISYYFSQFSEKNFGPGGVPKLLLKPIIGIRITIKEELKDKVVEALKQYCVDSQIKINISIFPSFYEIYYYLRDEEGTVYI